MPVARSRRGGAHADRARLERPTSTQLPQSVHTDGNPDRAGEDDAGRSTTPLTSSERFLR